MKRCFWVAVALALAAIGAGNASMQGPAYPVYYRGYGGSYDAGGAPVAHAVANRMNAQTEMMVQNYINECYKSVLKDYTARWKAKKQLVNETQETKLKAPPRKSRNSGCGGGGCLERDHGGPAETPEGVCRSSEPSRSTSTSGPSSESRSISAGRA